MVSFVCAYFDREQRIGDTSVREDIASYLNASTKPHLYPCGEIVQMLDDKDSDIASFASVGGGLVAMRQETIHPDVGLCRKPGAAL